MIRVRLDIESLSVVTIKSAQNQTASLHEFLQGMTLQHRETTEFVREKHQLVDERISRVEEMLRAQSEQIQAAQFTQIGPSYDRTRPQSQRRYSRPVSKNRTPQMPPRGEAVGIRLRQYVTVCRPGCPCACHSQTKKKTPGFVDRLLGQLFIGYAGLPFLNAPCDTDACDKPQASHASFEYWFPVGFCWSQIIRLQLAYQPNTGPQIALTTLRRVPDSAQCVSYALEGNIEGLKSLFIHGLASPRDVSSTRGYSLLRVGPSMS